MIQFRIEQFYRCLLFHSLAVGYLGCFQVFVIGINAAINISRHLRQSFFCHVHSGENAGSHVLAHANEIMQTIFLTNCINLHFR